MIVTTLDELPGYTEEEYYGVVTGSTIRSKNVMQDIVAGIRNLAGGEVEGYSALLEEARQLAVQRMTEQAAHKGANAILNVRFSTSDVARGAAEIYAYGTAVKVSPNV